MMIQEINPQNHQKIFFSYYEYGYPYNFYNPKQRIKLDKKLDVILISAIANTSYLLAYLDEEVEDIHHMNYEDHHLFSEIDIDYIHTVFTHREAKRKLILTTEKDAMRLDLHRAKLKELGIPVFVLPMQVKFHDDQETFDHDIKDFLLKYRS